MLDYHGLLNTEYAIGLYPYYPSQLTSVQATAGYDPFYCCIHSSLSIQTQIRHVLIMGFSLTFGLFYKRRCFTSCSTPVVFHTKKWFLNLDPNLRKSDICFANIFTGGSLYISLMKKES